MKYFKPFIPFIACWILLFYSNNFQSVALINGIAQLALFLFVVCIPIWKTGRMSYVDIGWPWGVALIGLITYCQANDITLSKTLVVTAYVLIGSRMGLVGAIERVLLVGCRPSCPLISSRKIAQSRLVRASGPA